jgi:hypothetical protein
MSCPPSCWTPLLCGNDARDAVLTGGGGDHRNDPFAVQVRLEFLGKDFRFDRLDRPVVRLCVFDFVELDDCGASDAFAVEPTRVESEIHRVADPEIAAIEPDVGLERLTRRIDVAASEEPSARFVGCFNRDYILLVVVRISQPVKRSIDEDFSDAVLIKRRLALCEQFGRVLLWIAAREFLTAPLVPAGAPIVVVGELPISASVEPIPISGGEIVGTIVYSYHAV